MTDPRPPHTPRGPRPPRTPRARTLLAASAALGLLLAGCGSSGDDDPAAVPSAGTDEAGTTTDASTATDGGSAADGGFPVTVDTDGGELTLEERPERIVSLSPAATEILFAIGAGDQVVAADEFSTYPEQAPTTDLSGFEPNVEAVAAYEPDLVVVAYDPGDLVASLDALDIPVLVDAPPVDVESGYDDIAAYGLLTGHVDETADVVAQMRSEMEEAYAAAPQDADVRVYHEVDDTFFAASSNSFIGSVYAELGAENVADEADTDASGYPQLTEEAVVAADPELIVITDEIGYGPEDVAARPGWSEVTAVRNDAIVVVDADIASRWGPRLPQLVQTLADAVAEAAAVPAGR
ncbi:ABC transporter substrate-binding protein [Ornithinimicrobium kibberense]|uniref:ABC transporter substrate-binding protein n=1 Tax=Ornithinimicrobium kibberense TaxID=282060 RepID=A0ABV5V5N2_9MICO|nr:ABC transporter substrate-binding protein [Ornithinimicrobium kibberense]